METNQTVLITGASSGIGLELAKLFAKDKYNLVIVSRKHDELEAAKVEINLHAPDANITTIAKDLSQHGAGEELYAVIKKRNIVVNTLVNDAGFGNYGLFADTDLKDDVDMVHLNVITLMTLTKLFLKDMLKRNEGKILQLGSVASFVPHQWLSAYAATKAFVLSLSESLQHEIQDSNVKITILCPNATDTNFFTRAGAENSKTVQGELDSPVDVAQQGYDALKVGEKRVIIGLKSKLKIGLTNVLPDSLLASMMANQAEPAPAAA